MLHLKENPTFQDIQKYVRSMEKERSFDHQSVRDKCLLPGEETGELFKAIREQEKGFKIGNPSKIVKSSLQFAAFVVIPAQAGIQW